MRREAYAGGFLGLVGGSILLLTWSYPRGTLSDIGPGTVLQLAGGLVLLLGLTLLLKNLLWHQKAENSLAFSARAAIIPGAMAAFGLLLPWLGLAIAGFIATWVASHGSPSLTRRERLLTAIILAAFVTLLFGYGLKLQVKLWP